MNRTLGQIAFEAYNQAKGGVTWDGKPIPPWGEVGAEVQAAWEAAAEAVEAEVRDRSRQDHVAWLEERQVAIRVLARRDAINRCIAVVRVVGERRTDSGPPCGDCREVVVAQVIAALEQMGAPVGA